MSPFRRGWTTHADLLANLLVDDHVYESTRSSNTILGGDQLLEGE